ncbi:hypothetical protein [uncultured Methanobrevibacter sp.]|uniref:hypothetical protein n=1 Tax=uncultured Methanobrevibacter sp. TaxID=253161 RepID=UPI0025DDE4EA|nr:hypothetical protein [uncultured Methanobrevibacter sp.]
MGQLQQDILQELTNNMEEDKMDDFDELYPELTLETDDMIMTIAVKKDYSRIEDLDKRKEEFINDLNNFIKEFSETPESDDFMRYYDY